MAEENVVIVGFAEASKAYQALSVLKECAADGRIRLDSAAIVERTAEGTLRIPEGTDNVGLIGTASGSLIGMLSLTALIALFGAFALISGLATIGGAFSVPVAGGRLVVHG
jgi:uncharacterized membrane protein